MEINVTNDKENKLLGRREIQATTSYTDKTPTKEQIKEEVCKRLSLDPTLVEIREISQRYGLRTCDITAYSYESKEVMAKLIKFKGEKGKKKEAKATATAAPSK